MKRIARLILRAAAPSLIVVVLVYTAISPLAQPGGDPLAAGFRTPPESARPRTWWHWTMSNVTRDGITKDLEWMKRVGIGGFMLADVNAGGGQTVEHKIQFGTPEWFDAVRHAAAEADRLGLEMAIFSSPGWSETGGPWVKPNEAMKKLVWSETTIAGPRKFSGTLPDPPRNNGQIRNTGPTGGSDPTWYGDSAVLAYRTPAGEMDAAAAKPIVTTSNGPVDGTPLLDDQLNTRLTIPAPKDGGPAWVQFDFPKPFTARAITIGGRGGSANGIPVGRVLASDDGKAFRTLVTLPGTQLYRQGMVRTFAFAPTTARSYRIELTGAPLGPAQTMSQALSRPAAEYVLSEAILHGGDPNASPVDANLLVALIAPRALLLQTGDTDTWSDPKGEFLAAIAARPVFELFGKHGPATDAFPPAGQIVGDTLAYYMHAGGHGMVPGDWAVYLDFLEKQFNATGRK